MENETLGRCCPCRRHPLPGVRSISDRRGNPLGVPRFRFERFFYKQIAVDNANPGNRGLRWAGLRFVSPRRKEAITGSRAFVATAVVVVLQNSSHRISPGAGSISGSFPSYPSLSYVMQAALVKTGGTAFWHHVAYAGVVGGLAKLPT